MGDLWRCRGIAGLAQLFGDEADGELLSGAHFAGRGEDLGGVFEEGCLRRS